MIGLKVALKDAEKWKQYILMNDLMDKEYYYVKDKQFIYFPIKEKFIVVKSKSISFVEKDFPKSIRKGTLKENLSGSLSKEEMAFVKTAHDVIGTIAIVEIPKDLEPRQKLIAEKLLEVNRNIKTVLKKANIHEGVFRTQKMTFLAGDNTKETIYKENNVRLKLDVEKVYFSIRLGNERKRIMRLVKPGEDILVMFSGCAPYPVVLAKNTKAKHITGIEINPDGHRYGLMNLGLNNIHNVLLINDDVHKAMPQIYKRIIGLKCAIWPQELNPRMDKNPSVIEIYMPDDGLDEKNMLELENGIISLKNKGLEVFVHMPHMIGGKPLIPEDKNSVKAFKKVGELCRKYKISAVVHITNGEKISEEKIILEHLKELEPYYDNFYFENSVSSFAKQEEILRIGRTAGFKNICIDIAHLYIAYGNTDKMVSAIKAVQKEFNTYFHVADHDKKTHTCAVGKGLIDFSKILPLVTKGVIEVASDDETHPENMIDSYEAIGKYHNKTYDRIIMPLPKTADEFLDNALSVAKKGTMIHFYDFLHIDKFDEAKEKIDKACKKRKMKYRIHDIFKCGQHAPYIYRICVDFEIL